MFISQKLYSKLKKKNKNIFYQVQIFGNRNQSKDNIEFCDSKVKKKKETKTPHFLM